MSSDSPVVEPAPEAVESAPEQPEAPEPEALIEESTPDEALDVGTVVAMAEVLDAYRVFNAAITQSALGATARDVLVEIQGQPWCRLKINPSGVAYVEALVKIKRNPED